MIESNFGFSDSCTARTREDENLRKPQVKAAIEYRPHVREDAGRYSMAFLILTPGRDDDDEPPAVVRITSERDKVPVL